MTDLLTNTQNALASATSASGVSRTKFMRAVAHDSGVGFEWLMKFSSGRITDPGVVRVQKLHDYLARNGQ